MNGGEAIKHWRKTVRSMTIQQFAGKMECSTSTVGKWESGDIREPPRSTAARIDDVLDAGGEILSAYGYGVESATEITQLRTELEALRGEAQRGRDYLWTAIRLVASRIEQDVREEVEEMHRAALANGDAPSTDRSPQRARRRA